MKPRNSSWYDQLSMRLPRAGPARASRCTTRSGSEVMRATPVSCTRWGPGRAPGAGVVGLLGRAWPAHAILVLLCLSLSSILGILTGVIQASTRRRALDTTLSVSTVTLFALPGYWLGLMLAAFYVRKRPTEAFGEFWPGEVVRKTQQENLPIKRRELL